MVNLWDLCGQTLQWLVIQLFGIVLPADLRTMILEKETELAKINKELKDLEHYKVSCPLFVTLYGMLVQLDAQ